ncbi:MAG: 4Fe-4S binding protein [Candidatus Tritonobacter lacicola]|nr:4Fe-4S binding protein [Candidatus Tritonobacter lacicola]
MKEGRTKRTKAYVNLGKCTGCGICVDICPVGAIKLREGKAVISDDCVACGQCVSECPSNAILAY